MRFGKAMPNAKGFSLVMLFGLRHIYVVVQLAQHLIVQWDLLLGSNTGAASWRNPSQGLLLKFVTLYTLAFLCLIPEQLYVTLVVFHLMLFGKR